MDRALSGRTSTSLGTNGDEGGSQNSFVPSEVEGRTLRQTALQAIADTRFVPDKGRKRIGSMVEGRPDWVISRQRAWGVPIALFVERSSGQLLVDADVNHRIVEAIKKDGVDAWCDENADHFLGPNRDPEDFERVTDILDVWFDSGCTSRLNARKAASGPSSNGPPTSISKASDQHRGWFQSSLLESCGTRGRGALQAVLTHGFTMDSKGMKCPRASGNTINPLDLMKESGARHLAALGPVGRQHEDHRIGKEILAGVSDQYSQAAQHLPLFTRRARRLLDKEKLPVEADAASSSATCCRCSRARRQASPATEDFDFNSYTRLIADFANNDLSAFYFDIRKDCLYCDAPVGPEAPRLPDGARRALPRPRPLVRPGAGVHQRGSVGHALPGRRLGALAGVARTPPHASLG
jgi:isoleucyl-tRNA synthetase